MKNLGEKINSKENKNGLMNSFKGIVIAFILTLVLLFIFAIILTFTNVKENVIPPVIIVISIISILIGSSICARKIKRNGIVYGGMIGLIYIGSIYVISSIVDTGFSLNIYAIVMMILSILAGMVRWDCWGEYRKINYRLTQSNIFYYNWNNY